MNGAGSKPYRFRDALHEAASARVRRPPGPALLIVQVESHRIFSGPLLLLLLLHRSRRRCHLLS
jgi:hypothetical protein